MIAVIASMKNELQFLDRTELVAEEKSGIFTFERRSFGGRDMVTAVCGTGKVAAAICTQKLIDVYSPDLIVSVGTAGSLVDTHGVNSVVIVDDIIQHDYDLSPFGYKRGEQCELGIVEMVCDKGFLGSAREVADRYGNVFFGRCLSGDRVIVSESDKKQLTSVFGGVCCDMECAAVAETCLFNSVPFAAVKGISDGEADEDDRGDEFRNNIVSASANLGEVLLAVIEARY